MTAVGLPGSWAVPSDPAPGGSWPAHPGLGPELGKVRIRVTGPAVALGFVALASAIWALVERNGGQGTVAAAIVVALVVDGWLARRALRRVELQVSAPPVTRVGQPLRWTLTCRRVTRPLTVATTAHPRPPVAVDRDGTATLEESATGRGVIDFALVDVTARGPLGLIEAGRRARCPLPEAVRVGPAPLPQDVERPPPRPTAFGPVDTTPVGDELVRSLRDYARGDPPRRVDWKATAHHGRLMVRELDGTGTAVLRIAVHLPLRTPAAEVAVSLAAWLATRALAQGWLVELVVLEPERVLPTPGFPLGSPYGLRPFVAAQPPQPMRIGTHRVRNEVDIARVLALASFGPVTAPRGRGLSCVVSPEGVTWS